MTGIFSRLSVLKSVQQPTQSAADTHEAPEDVEIEDIEIDIEFSPVEHPIEPISQDQPVRCPLPESSVLNDGRTWKERRSSTSSQVRTDFPVMKKVGAQIGKEAVGRRHQSAPRSRPILPSAGTPEHQIMKLLQECKTAGGRTAAT